MRSERERRALTTILDHAVLARTWVGDLDERTFAEDRKTFCYAVTYCLEPISWQRDASTLAPVLAFATFHGGS